MAAFLRPAGKVIPILSSLSRNIRPPFLDLALQKVTKKSVVVTEIVQHENNTNVSAKIWVKPLPVQTAATISNRETVLSLGHLYEYNMFSATTMFLPIFIVGLISFVFSGGPGACQ